MYEKYADDCVVKFRMTKPDKIQEILDKNSENSSLVLKINNLIYQSSVLNGNKDLQTSLEEMAKNNRIGFIGVEPSIDDPSKGVYQLLVYEKNGQKIRLCDQLRLPNVDNIEKLYRLQESIGLEFSLVDLSNYS